MTAAKRRRQAEVKEKGAVSDVQEMEMKLDGWKVKLQGLSIEI